jgi:hypothetical protein
MRFNTPLSADDIRHPGGSLEPVNRDSSPQKYDVPPPKAAAERFELNNLPSRVTYRAHTLEDIAAKADQLGASRFDAVAPDGKRTSYVRADATWRRSSMLEASLDPRQQPGDPELIPARLVIDMGLAAPPTVPAEADPVRRLYKERIATALHERYAVKHGSVSLGDITHRQTVYHYPGEPTRVAFTEALSRLVTQDGNPAVARSMIDVAELRNWNEVRVFGRDDFKRAVWLEATLRGVKTVGYDPSRGDLAKLEQERLTQRVGRTEPTTPGPITATIDKQAPDGGRRTAVLAAIDAALIERKVPANQRSAVMKFAGEKLSPEPAPQVQSALDRGPGR